VILLLRSIWNEDKKLISFYFICTLAGNIYATARAKRCRLPHVQNLYEFLNVAYHFKNTNKR